MDAATSYDGPRARRSTFRPILLAVMGWSGIFASLAAAQIPKTNMLGLPARMLKGTGKLMICGGGPMSDGFRHEFIRLADGAKAKIVIIPTAMPFPNRHAMEERFSSWKEMPIESLSFLDTESRDEANQEDFVKPLEGATGVWISGGEQGRLADVYVGTKVEEALLKVLERGGVVGGTSAGAAIMSKMMIRYGSPKAVVGAGFNLLAHAVVDQHFLQRHRQERLLGVLADHPEMVGLGIDEGAALVVQGDHLRVLGDSQVIICKNNTGANAPWMEALKPGDEVDLIAPAAPADPAATEADPVARRRLEAAIPVLAHRSEGP